MDPAPFRIGVDPVHNLVSSCWSVGDPGANLRPGGVFIAFANFINTAKPLAQMTARIVGRIRIIAPTALRRTLAMPTDDRTCTA